MAGDAARQQAVDDLVDGTVAAQRDHDVDPVGRGLFGEPGRVPALAGVLDLQVHDAAQRLDQHVAYPSARGGRLVVHHQQRPHGWHCTRTV